MSRPAPRVLLALLCALLCGAVLTACGNDDEGDRTAARASTSDLDGILEDTFGDGRGATKSGRLAAALRFVPQGMRGLDGPITARLTGPFSGDGEGLPRFDVALKGAIAGSPIDAGAVSTGEKGFLRLRGKTYELGDGFFGQFKDGFGHSEDDRDGKGPTFESLGIDPRRWLTRARIAGTDEVDGVEAIHVTGGIDAVRLLADIDTVLGKAGEIGVLMPGESPSSISREDQRLIAGAVRTATVDVWTGRADRHLRRLAVDIGFAVPEAARDSVAGLREGTMKLDLRISEVNEAQKISAPKNARPLTDLLGPGLGSLLGGSGGSGSQGGGPGAGSAYLECLQKAGSDIAEIQACATELTR